MPDDRPTNYRAEDPQLVRSLIDLRHADVSWEECAEKLGRTADALNGLARRLRDAGQWTLADGKPARGAPERGKRGRPRNKVPTQPISPRFTPDVAAAIRTVATCANKLTGEVMSEAMQRAIDRHNGKKVSKTPLGLDPGKPFDLCDGNRTETMAANVPEPVYTALIKTNPGAYPSTLIADAVHRLLHDLNYRLVDCSA